MPKKVLIVGAGAAGLACGAELARAGTAVTILEGRNRIGGRIFSQPVSGLSIPAELGAEFVHGMPPEILQPMKGGGEEIIEPKVMTGAGKRVNSARVSSSRK